MRAKDVERPETPRDLEYITENVSQWINDVFSVDATVYSGYK